MPDSQVELVVRVNLLGVLLCSKKAIELMSSQPSGGCLFNTVGSGVKGGGTPGYACYGSTKRGLPQLTASLNDEIQKGVQGYDKKKTPGEVKVYSLSPGMVFTKVGCCLLDSSSFHPSCLLTPPTSPPPPLSYYSRTQPPNSVSSPSVSLPPSLRRLPPTSSPRSSTPGLQGQASSSLAPTRS